MKRIFVLAIAIGLTQLAIAQSAVSGRVINSQSREAVPYVSIGIENKATGTVSNIKGEFFLKLRADISSADSVIFSSIGYKTVKHSIADLQKPDNEVFIVPQTYSLEEVVVTDRPTKEIILGRNSAGSGFFECPFFISHEIQSSDRISREIGMLFTTKSDCRLNSLNFFIKRNNYESVKFRLTFYSVENDMPKDIIVNQEIIFDVKEQYKGWFKVDLQPYCIFINKRDSFVVTLTLLEDQLISNRNWFSFPGALISNYNVYRKDKAMDKWTKNNYAISMYLEATSLF